MRRKSIKNYFDELCSLRAENPREFWKALRPMMHTKKGSLDEFITLKEKQMVIKDQSEVAEILNEYFTNITKDLISHKYCAFKDQSHVFEIPMVSGESTANIFGLQLTNHHVVEVVLEDIKPNKVQGHDFVSLQALKVSSQTKAKPLSDLINTVITRAEVPDTWKHGQITPHYKNGSVLDKTNLRPVTILPSFGKVFERIIHMQMMEHFEPIFHNFMFAHHKFHECPTALLTLTEHWREELDKYKVTGAVAMDLSKAFDCLLH